MNTREDVSDIIVLLGVGASVFGMLSPPWHSVINYSGADRDAKIQQARAGSLAASLIVMTIGVAVAKFHRSQHAIYTAVVIIFIFNALQNYAIGNPNDGD